MSRAIASTELTVTESTVLEPYVFLVELGYRTVTVERYDPERDDIVTSASVDWFAQDSAGARNYWSTEDEARADYEAMITDSRWNLEHDQ